MEQRARVSGAMLGVLVAAIKFSHWWQEPYAVGEKSMSAQDKPSLHCKRLTAAITFA